MREPEVTLLEGDSRAVLAGLRAGSADCCITSPPYFREGDRGRYVEEMLEAFGEIRRVVRAGAAMWLVLGGDAGREVADALSENGWPLRAEFVWEESAELRQSVFAMAGAEAPDWEPVLRYSTPAAREDYPWSVLPEELVERCMRASTRPGDTVLDPFCGLGTVGVAARRLGRAFIGVERDRRVLQLAWERIRNSSTGAGE